MPQPIALPGAVHMHTVYSDGTGTYPELIAAARAAGLGWIIVTDHNSLEGLPYQGWHDGLLVAVGNEITPDRNHFLALGVERVVSHELPPQDFIDEVYAAGGFGIIAHPDEQVANSLKDIYRWDDWAVDGPRERAGRSVGIEIWNLMSDWAEHAGGWRRFPLAFLPRFGLSGPTPATLAWWDRLNMAGRRTFAVGGVDAHAFRHKVPWGVKEIFPYRWMFGTLTNYLLLDGPLPAEPAAAVAALYGALAAGRSYFVNRLDGDCPALRFEARRGAEAHPIGSSVALAGGPLTIVADVGAGATVRLIANGRPAASGRRSLRHVVAAPGVYRLEAYWGGKPWVYSNPIYITA